MRDLFNSFVSDESGQGLVEYTLIIALVSVALIAILTVFRGQLGTLFNFALREIDGAGPEAVTPAVQ
jgi:pilus assembly protein Flp/PilA